MSKMKNHTAKLLPVIFVAFVPTITFAAATITSEITLFMGWINKLIPLLLSFAVVFFLWGLVKFMYHAGDEKSHEEGRKLMTWGIVAIFVMVSFWGIVAFLQNSLKIDGSQVTGKQETTIPINIPQL